MSPEGLHAVPPHEVPAVLTVDAGSTGALTPRFLTLVVRAHRVREEPPAAQPARLPVEDLPTAS